MDRISYLKEGLRPFGIELTQESLAKLLRFQDMVLEANKVMNLTSITEEEAFIELHLIDSLTVLPSLSGAQSVIDVGTGAGFPGMVLKIARPELKLTLLDSLNKRLVFLARAAQELELEDIQFLHQRAEDAAHMQEHRERYDAAVSRAVAHLSPLCEYCIPFVKTGGVFAAMKGKNAREEEQEAGACHSELGCANPMKREFTLPYSGAQRTIFLYRKEKNTPPVYPRSPKQIKNKRLS